MSCRSNISLFKGLDEALLSSEQTDESPNAEVSASSSCGLQCPDENSLGSGMIYVFIHMIVTFATL